MSTIWKVKIHNKVCDKNPGDSIQPIGLISSTKKKIPSTCRSSNTLMIPSHPAQDPCVFSWRQLDSAKLLTIMLVSEARFQKWKGDHNSLKSEGRKRLLQGHKAAEAKVFAGSWRVERRGNDMSKSFCKMKNKFGGGGPRLCKAQRIRNFL